MHLTPIQEKFIQDVTDTVITMGGMQTKYHSFPLTIATKMGVLHIKPTFEGIACQFDEPARATAQGIPCHRMKGTWNFDLPLGSTSDPSAYDALITRFNTDLKPLLTSHTKPAII